MKSNSPQGEQFKNTLINAIENYSSYETHLNRQKEYVDSSMTGTSLFQNGFLF
jgi:hypothetical protein